MSIATGQGTQTRENLTERQNPQTLARETREAYREQPEKPGILERASILVTNEANKIMTDFESGQYGKAIGRGVVLGGGALLVGYGFKKLFDFGSGIFSKFKNSITEGATEVVKNTLKTVLKTIIGGSVVGLIADKLTGGKTIDSLLDTLGDILSKAGTGVDDIARFIGHPTELADYILKLHTDGKVELPSWVLTAVTTLKGGISSASEAASQGYEGIKAGLASVYAKSAELGYPVPDSIKNFSVSEMAETLGLKQYDASTYVEFVGIGGASWFLMSFLKKKGKMGLLLANAGVFLGIVSQGKEGGVGSILSEYTHEFDRLKSEWIAKASKTNAIAGELALMLPSFSAGENMDFLLDIMKAHPAMAMGTFNAAWLFKGAIIGSLKFSLKASLEGGKFAFKHWKTAGFGFGAMMFFNQNKKLCIDTILSSIYGDEISLEKEKMQSDLYSALSIDKNEKYSHLGVQAMDIIKSLTEDPIKAFSSFKNEITEMIRNGDVIPGYNTVQGFFFLAKGFAIPIQLGKAAWTEITGLQNIFSDDTQVSMTSIIVNGTLSYVFTSMAWEASKAFKMAIWDTATRGAIHTTVWKTFKSLVPGSKEFMFIARSSALGIPGIRSLLQDSMSGKIAHAEEIVENLRTVLKGNPRSISLHDINHIRHEFEAYAERYKIMSHHDINELLPGTSYGLEFRHAQVELEKEIGMFRSQLNRLQAAVIHRDTAGSMTPAIEREFSQIQEAVDIQTDNIRKITNKYRSAYVSWLKRYSLISQGKFEELRSMNLEMNTEDAIKERAIKSPVADDIRELLSKGNYTQQIADIEAEIATLTARGISPDNSYIQGLRRHQGILHGIDSGKLPAINPASLEHLATSDAPKLQEELRRLSTEHIQIEAGINARIQQEIEAVQDFARTNGLKLSDPVIQERLAKINEEFVEPFAKTKSQNIKAFNALYKKLPAALRTKELATTMKSAMYGTEKSLYVRVKEGAVGRAKLMGVMAALFVAKDVVSDWDNIKREPIHELAGVLHNIGPEITELLLGVLPFVGTAVSAYSTISGKSALGNDQSSFGDRASNLLFGVAGAIGDATMLASFGASTPAVIAGRIGIVTAKLGSRGARIAEMLTSLIPKFTEIANNMGGWKKFAEAFVELITASMKNPQAIQKYAMFGGLATVVGQAGVGYFYHNTDAIDTAEIDDDLQQTANDNIPGAQQKQAA